MIVYSLKCSAGHGFEAWFKDGASYERQAAAGAVECPECGDTTVNKALMAPAVGRRSAPAPAETSSGTDGPAAGTADPAARVKAALRAMRRTVEANCDYVGPRFAHEARKIHNGEADARGIYGEATETEAKSLADEGVEIARIPWVPLEDA